jgi:hypothetical protein
VRRIATLWRSLPIPARERLLGADRARRRATASGQFVNSVNLKIEDSSAAPGTKGTFNVLFKNDTDNPVSLADFLIEWTTSSPCVSFTGATESDASYIFASGTDPVVGVFPTPPPPVSDLTFFGSALDDVIVPSGATYGLATWESRDDCVNQRPRTSTARRSRSALGTSSFLGTVATVWAFVPDWFCWTSRANEGSRRHTWPRPTTASASAGAPRQADKTLLLRQHRFRCEIVDPVTQGILGKLPDVSHLMRAFFRRGFTSSRSPSPLPLGPCRLPSGSCP